jgi:hypothetical protein
MTESFMIHGHCIITDQIIGKEEFTKSKNRIDDFGQIILHFTHFFGGD